MLVYSCSKYLNYVEVVVKVLVLDPTYIIIKSRLTDLNEKKAKKEVYGLY